MADLELQIDQRLLTPLSTSRFIYTENPDYDGSNCAILISLQTLAKYDFKAEGENLSMLEHCLVFCKAVYGDTFDETHPAWDNFGFATYEGDTLKRFAKPIIVKHDGQIVLLQGRESKSEGVEFVRTPLVCNEGQITLEGSSIFRLGLSSIDIKQSDKSILKIPIVTFKGGNQVYSIALRTSQDLRYYDLQEAWENAKKGTPESWSALTELINPLYGASANLGTMFSKHFIEKRFPLSGVILPVNGCRTQVVDVPAKEGSKASKFDKFIFNIDFSLIPEFARHIQVLAYQDGENAMTELGNVTSVTCFDNFAATFPVKEGRLPTSETPWYIWIEKSGSDPNQKPTHQVYEGFLPGRHKKILTAMSNPQYLLGTATV